MTALQELIEIIKDKRKESDISNTLLRFCQVEAEKLLEKEKEVIINAYDYVLDNAVFEKDGDGYIHIDLSADEYYNFNFNHNSE